VHADPEADHVVAVIVPHEANLRLALSGSDKPLATLCGQPDVQALVLKESNAVGKHHGLKGRELLAGVVLTAEEWTPESGLVTAAQKLQRRNIAQTFEKELKVSS
jgi:long-chain acyl-CoA synthetase